MKIQWRKLSATVLFCGVGPFARAQVADGPRTQKVAAQQEAPKIELRSILVTTPVTVRDANGVLGNQLQNYGRRRRTEDYAFRFWRRSRFVGGRRRNKFTDLAGLAEDSQN